MPVVCQLDMCLTHHVIICLVYDMPTVYLLNIEVRQTDLLEETKDDQGVQAVSKC